MKKTFGKWGCILAMFIGVLVLSLNEETVYAEEPQYLGTIIDGSVLTNQSEAEDLQQTRLRNSYLAQGFVKITNNGKVQTGKTQDWDYENTLSEKFLKPNNN